MPRTKISEFSATAADNTDIDGINIAEGCAPSVINNAIRELMSQLKDFQTGAGGDSFNGVIGATTPAAGNFTTIGATGDVSIADKIIHTGDTNTAIRFPAADTVTVETSGVERLRIDTSGNLLLGSTTTPASNAVKQVITGGTSNYLEFISTSGGGGIVGNNGSNLAFFTLAGSIGSETYSERMRITDTGNIGIGTTSPQAKAVVSNGGAAGFEFFVNYPGGGTGTYIQSFNRSGGAYVDTAYDAATHSFRTSGTERMRITSGGEVYIAGTTDQGAYNLQVNGTGVWGAGAYVNGSDARIKEDVAPIDSGLDVVAKLNPVTYRYKEDWSKDQSIQPGFIAQELLVALEGTNYVDGVVTQGGKYMSVAYQNLIPVLTKAIQEQQTLIENLTTRLNALEGK